MISANGAQRVSYVPPEIRDVRVHRFYEAEIECRILEEREDRRALRLEVEGLNASLDSLRRYDGTPLQLSVVDSQPDKKKVPKFSDYSTQGNPFWRRLVAERHPAPSAQPTARLLTHEDIYGPVKEEMELPPEMVYAASAHSVVPSRNGKWFEKEELKQIAVRGGTKAQNPLREISDGQEEPDIWEALLKEPDV